MTAGTALTTGSLATALGGELRGRGDIAITGVNSIADAQGGELTFIAHTKYAAAWPQCMAAAAIVSEGIIVPATSTDDRPLIVVPNAELAMVPVLEMLAPPPSRPEPGVHHTAFIHPDADIGSGVCIGPHVSVDRGCRLGDGVILHPGVRVYADVSIGDGSELHANCVVRERCVIGRGVILHQNVSIGADGFGYRPSPDGQSLMKMPHIGNVVIEDGVEIGANSCVDRGKFSSTTIGQGTKIDNLVQIAHNCRIGRCCVIAGQAGAAGSVRLGDGVQMGAQVGIAEGISVGNGVRIGAKAGVMKDIEAGASVHGVPAENARVALRQAAAIRKLPELVQELSRQSRTKKR